ncbi:MAG: VOC family protein [Pseudomonadota bacterium]|nr:VOC family protein [Pseudomonadota bacterium]
MLTIDHVQVAAPTGCEAAARSFYGRLLGLAELAKPGDTLGNGGAWFRAGDRELHVGVDPEFRPAHKAHVGLAAADRAALEALAERLSGAGHPVKWDTRLIGVRRFFVDDPWGNRVEILARE